MSEHGNTEAQKYDAVIEAAKQRLADAEQWRADMFRMLRRLWLLAAAAEATIIVILVWHHAWAALPPVVTALLVLSFSRWMLSARGQKVLGLLRERP